MIMHSVMLLTVVLMINVLRGVVQVLPNILSNKQEILFLL